MKKILISIDWFLPGYKAGGPIVSVINIIKNLKEKYEFYVITSDRDLNDVSEYKNVELDKWLDRDGYKIFYISKKSNKLLLFKQILTAIKFSAIYFNSLFSIKFTFYPLLISRIKSKETKIILAPRGMMGSGAFQIKKIKKSLFVFICRLFKIHSKTIWHATNEHEAYDIKNKFGLNTQIKIISNITSVNCDKVLKPNLNIIKFFFYSRISEKKNLDYALKVLSKIYIKNEIQFDILGPSEDEQYWNKCQNIIMNLDTKIKVNYIGTIQVENIKDVLSNYHFLFLPTKHENYGHVIIEAIASGCPIIISNNTPWQNLEEKNIGWDIDLNDEEKFIKTIEYCVNISQEEYNKMSENCFNFAKQIVEDNSPKELYLSLFQ